MSNRNFFASSRFGLGTNRSPKLVRVGWHSRGGTHMSGYSSSETENTGYGVEGGALCRMELSLLPVCKHLCRL